MRNLKDYDLLEDTSIVMLFKGKVPLYWSFTIAAKQKYHAIALGYLDVLALKEKMFKTIYEKNKLKNFKIIKLMKKFFI